MYTPVKLVDESPEWAGRQRHPLTRRLQDLRRCTPPEMSLGPMELTPREEGCYPKVRPHATREEGDVPRWSRAGRPGQKSGNMLVPRSCYPLYSRGFQGMIKWTPATPLSRILRT